MSTSRKLRATPVIPSALASRSITARLRARVTAGEASALPSSVEPASATLTARQADGKLAGITLKLELSRLERGSDFVIGVGLDLGQLALRLLPDTVAFHRRLFPRGFSQRFHFRSDIGQPRFHGRGARIGFGA